IQITLAKLSSGPVLADSPLQNLEINSTLLIAKTLIARWLASYFPLSPREVRAIILAALELKLPSVIDGCQSGVWQPTKFVTFLLVPFHMEINIKNFYVYLKI
ncbi:Hypothetical protein FKW44_000002, partial [Caligus rogercresseyi]